MSSIRMLVAAMLLAATMTEAAHPQSAPAEAEPQSDAEQRAQMRREVDEAAGAIEGYPTSRREQAMRRAQTATERMDRRIRLYQAEWLAQAEAIKAERQMERERSMARVAERRAALEERYRELQQANAQAWERARDRFVQAYRALADALGVASQEAEADQAAENDSSREQD